MIDKCHLLSEDFSLPASSPSRVDCYVLSLCVRCPMISKLNNLSIHWKDSFKCWKRYLIYVWWTSHTPAFCSTSCFALLCPVFYRPVLFSLTVTSVRNFYSHFLHFTTPPDQSVQPMEVQNMATTWTHFSMLIMSLRYSDLYTQLDSSIICNDETGIFLTPLVWVVSQYLDERKLYRSSSTSYAHPDATLTPSDDLTNCIPLLYSSYIAVISH